MGLFCFFFLIFIKTYESSVSEKSLCCSSFSVIPHLLQSSYMVIHTSVLRDLLLEILEGLYNTAVLTCGL